MNENIKRIIILICGVPGTGKTTITNNIINKLNNKLCFKLSFDDFQLEKGLFSFSFFLSFFFFLCSYSLISSLLHYSLLISDVLELWNENSFIEIRNNCLNYLKDILSDDNNCYEYILIDDIMYYRSMRKKVYQIAREYNSRFIIIYAYTSLENCLLRNLNRPEETRVSEEVIIIITKNKNYNNYYCNNNLFNQ